jgi:Beta/Gamma crystallin
MMKLAITAVVALLAALPATAKPGPAGGADPGQLVLYEVTNFRGDSYVVDDAQRMSMQTPWNIHSVSVYPGEKWEICAKPRFRAPCMNLTESLPDSSVVGINGQIGSARRIPAK